MTSFQKIVKYAALGLAIFLTVSIIGGILSILGIFGGFFNGDAVEKDLRTYTVSSDISAIKIEINAADFWIKQGNGFSVESNLKYLTVKDTDGVLTIKETRKFGTYNGAKLTLYIPADAEFETANIKTGAGRLTVESLSADVINFNLGAGEVNIDTLIAKSGADINGGAGKITISDGLLHNLDLKMGVGQFNLTSMLTGRSDFNLGVGESNITVIGNKDDYKLNIKKGLGNVTVDGVGFSSVKDFGNGDNSIDIRGGVGAIHVQFKESEAEKD